MRTRTEYERNYYRRNKDRLTALRHARIKADPEKYRKKVREYYRKNKEKALAWRKKWRENNLERARAIRNRYRDKHPDRETNWYLLNKYGIDLAKYNEMAAHQDGKCAICDKPEPTGKRLAVDHCHATKKIRGLLCLKCNTAIGKLNDDPELLEAAARYLRK